MVDGILVVVVLVIWGNMPALSWSILGVTADDQERCCDRSVWKWFDMISVCHSAPLPCRAAPRPRRHTLPLRLPVHLREQSSRCSRTAGRLCSQRVVARSWMQSCAGRPFEPTWCRSCKSDQYPCISLLHVPLRKSNVYRWRQLGKFFVHVPGWEGA